MKKRKLLNDLSLVGTILFCALVAFLVFKSCNTGGEKVNVIINGKVFKTYNLNEDARATIATGDENQQENVLVIKDGVAYIESATCPDKICVEHAPIKMTGETIVCLPHGVVIEIVK